MHSFTCNSTEAILGMEKQERGVGAEDIMFIEFNSSLLVQKSLSYKRI